MLHIMLYKLGKYLIRISEVEHGPTFHIKPSSLAAIRLAIAAQRDVYKARMFLIKYKAKKAFRRAS